jgi:hypothetical protein
MAEQRKQKTQPKGKNKKTGEPHEPVEIPVPNRKTFEAMLKRAALRKTSTQK